ncbi:MAG: hypothetical protein GVY13_09615 [Alphaproteobacteria bacterium]|jgi:hypothetical protein|nr:hypothetical protein [Alphaproteobacteria bacterium]
MLLRRVDDPAALPAEPPDAELIALCRRYAPLVQAMLVATHAADMAEFAARRGKGPGAAAIAALRAAEAEAIAAVDAAETRIYSLAAETPAGFVFKLRFRFSSNILEAERANPHWLDGPYDRDRPGADLASLLRDADRLAGLPD